MALKDLIAQEAEFAEEALIESIVAGFVEYVPAKKVVRFTQATHSLTNREKVLVYLVALQGWPFVADEPIPPDAERAEIRECTGISGNSLGPLLKELKDTRMIAERGGRYFARAMSFAAIEETISGRFKPKTKTPSDATGSDQGKRFRKKRIAGITRRFEAWIDDGFFDTPRSYTDAHARFRKEGIIVPRSSVPKYLMRGLQSGRLEREKKLRGLREVWVYQRGKKR